MLDDRAAGAGSAIGWTPQSTAELRCYFKSGGAPLAPPRTVVGQRR